MDRDRTDDELVGIAATGDSTGAAILFARHVDRIHDFILRLSGDPDESADLTARVFHAVFARVDDIRRPGEFVTLLHATAYQRVQVADLGREVSRTPPTGSGLGALDPDRAPPGTPAATARQVWEAARQLDRRTLAVLDLDLRSTLSAGEIADVVAAPRGHADQLVRTARRRFADRVGSHIDDPVGVYRALAVAPMSPSRRDVIWRGLSRDLRPAGGQDQRWGRVAAVVVGAIAALGLLAMAVADSLDPDQPEIVALTAEPFEQSTVADDEPGTGTDAQPLPSPIVPLEGTGTEGPTASPTPAATETSGPTPSPEPSPEPSPTAEDPPPSAEIDSPPDGSTLEASDDDGDGDWTAPAVLTARVEDDAPDQLTYRWTSDVDGELSTAPQDTVELSHSTGCPEGLATPTRHLLTLEITDAAGSVVTDQVEVTVTCPEPLG